MEKETSEYLNESVSAAVSVHQDEIDLLGLKKNQYGRREKIQINEESI